MISPTYATAVNEYDNEGAQFQEEIDVYESNIEYSQSFKLRTHLVVSQVQLPTLNFWNK
jgi:hypothetical protein